MADVICMGELLIDFVSTQSGVSLVGAPAFKKAPAAGQPFPPHRRRLPP